VNYSDGLTDLPLSEMVSEFQSLDKTAMFMVTRPQRSFHVVRFNKADHHVEEISSLNNSGLWINAGYFILRNEIFNYLNAGEELVDHAMPRLANVNKLAVYPYEGTWVTMDTFKEKQMLDDMYSRGETPWEVWKDVKLNRAMA
jgi:glucose-1-phosphate cytidylyltransferase